ncbi:MAG: MFS transporter [Nocardioides sp.]
MRSTEEGTSKVPIARDKLVCTQLFVNYGFLAFGMGLVPALLTTFRSTYELSGSATANIQNSKDIGLVVAALACPPIMRKLGLGGAQQLAIGAALAGCAAYAAWPSYMGVLAGAFFHGAAFSLGSVAIVTRMFLMPTRYRKIAALLATFGVASMLAPIMVGWLVPLTAGYSVVYLVFAAILLGALTLLSRIGDSPPAPVVDYTVSARGTAKRLRSRLAMFGVIASAETIVVGWITSLMQYEYATSLVVATNALALLWIVHTLSRAVGDIVAARISQTRTIAWGAAISFVGVLLMIGGTASLAYVGVALFAIGVAPLVPIYQGMVLSEVPDSEHGVTNSALGMTAALSTTVVVWVTGILLDLETRLPFVIAAAVFAFLSLAHFRYRNKSTMPSYN